MNADEFAQFVSKTKDLIKSESARALADIDTYTAMATSHAYAAHEDIQRAIEVSRRAQDAVSEAKSSVILAIDDVLKELQTAQ